MMKVIKNMAVLCLAVVFAAGCNSGVAKQQPADENGGAKLVFRLCNDLTPDSRICDISEIFRKEIEKASPDGEIAEGEIKVEYLDQGIVGGERSLLESCYFDVLEMVQVNSSIMTMLDDAYSLLDLPYLFQNEDQHKAVIYGEIGQSLLDRLDRYNLCGLGFFSTEFRNIFFKSSKPLEVNSPESLRGLKLRVMESPVMINAIGAMGATAAPIPSSELFQSIKTGVVDGADNCARIFISSKFGEAGCNHFVQTEHFSNQHMIIANKKWFDSLEPKYQKRIREVIEYTQKAFDDVWKQVLDESIAQMKAEGIIVQEVEDKSPFIKSTEGVLDWFSKQYPEVTDEYLSRILEIRDRKVTDENN